MNIANLVDQERTVFLQKVFLPMSFWGVTGKTFRYLSFNSQRLLQRAVTIKSASAVRRAARHALNRKLTQRQANAVVEAHRGGFGEIGKDGTRAGRGNYTTAQIRKKRNC